MKPDQFPKIDLNSMPLELRLYFEARQNNELPKYYLERFRLLRDGYSNDLPAEDVRDLVKIDQAGKFIGEKYKCEGSYIVGLTINLEQAVEDRVIADPGLIRTIDDFKNRDWKYKKRERTTKEEIDIINATLNAVIGYLEEISKSPSPHR